MNSNTRIYLKKELTGSNISKNETNRIENRRYLNDNTMGSALDLGMAPFQRIINEMRTLHSGGEEVIFNPKAARQAGMPPYCSYLKGIKQSQNSHEELNKILREAQSI